TARWPRVALTPDASVVALARSYGAPTAGNGAHARRRLTPQRRCTKGGEGLPAVRPPADDGFILIRILPPGPRPAPACRRRRGGPRPRPGLDGLLLVVLQRFDDEHGFLGGRPRPGDDGELPAAGAGGPPPRRGHGRVLI